MRALRSSVLRIGPVQLDTPLLLAPIAGYCDLAFRTVCRELGGVGLACTDLLSPQGLLRGTATSLDLARTDEFDRPIGMQLYGSVPTIMGEGARWAADHGATVVDINMGCPVDKVTKKDGGSRLMVPDEGIDASACRRFSKALSVAQAVRAALPAHVPMTCKMRLGWRCADDAPKLACALVDAGAAAITVHGRTTEQKFKGEADWGGIAAVVEAVRAHSGDAVPVIGNGDVREPIDAVRMMRRTGCAGVMIGRGALSTPWIFREAWKLIRAEEVVRAEGGCHGLSRKPCGDDARHGLPSGSDRGAPASHVEEPSDDEKVEIVRRFFELMRAHRDDRYALEQIRRRISWFGKRIGGGHCKGLKEAVRTAETPERVHGVLDRWREFADLRLGHMGRRLREEVAPA